MKIEVNCFVLFLVTCVTAVSSLPGNSRQDDAEVIESADSGGIDNAGSITSPDGPGPSVLGSLDKIFKSVKEFDQYQCIERMMCEYMQGNTDVGGIGSLLGGGSEGSGIASGLSAIPGLSALTGLFGGGSTAQTAAPVRGAFPPQQFQGQQFAGQQFAGQPGFPAGPTGFARPPRGVQAFQPSPPAASSGFFGTVENLLFGNRRRNGNGRRNGRRKKRQTNLQGNLIRLMQATKLDNLNAFPYVRAALIGYSAKNQNGGITRAGGGSCAQLYRECPTEPKQLLNYINNHNGGLVNQVQPSVDNEVAPILGDIVKNLVGSSGSSSSSVATKLTETTTSSPTFAAADNFITNAIVQGASGPFSNALSSLANMITGTKTKK